jgi:soluble lytic murein transglycosylase-like protein
MMRQLGFILAALAAVVAGAPRALADYAVLRSGLRLHITGYETLGDRVRLTVPGGMVNVAASDVAAIEPEDRFPPPPVAQSLSSAPFGRMIRSAAKETGIDENLITRVIAVESNFNPRAVSQKRAQGLMQLLPETAARYSVSDAFDPAQNIEAGTRYLRDLLQRYRGNLALALAAYNAGPAAVERYGGVPPFTETQNYVRRITSALILKLPISGPPK